MPAVTDERVRYPDSIDPVRTDGRDVDTNIGVLEGEAARQNVRRADKRLQQIAPAAWDRVPQISETETTYYDRPLLKPSVWSADIPLYYFLGGTAGAAMTLGAAIQLAAARRRRELQRLSAVCHWTGIVGSTAGAAFLIHDLGRPSRFLYMLRVFRPTSPMNMGAWILSGAAPTAIATGLLANRGGLLEEIGRITGYAAGLFGAALAGYTGVLVANTAIPVWQESRRWLPVLFIGSSAASAASVINMVSAGNPAFHLTRSFGTAGRLAEIIAARRVERTASVIPQVGAPLRDGPTGTLWKTATLLTVASLVVSLLPGRSGMKRKAAGLLGAAGSLCLRFAVHYAGNASARDPKALFQQQRAIGWRK